MQRSGWRRWLAPAALFVGLALVGASLLVLAGVGGRERDVRLEASKLVVVNGTAVTVYPSEYYGYSNARIDVAFRFPTAPGNAYFIGCRDIAHVLSAGAPEDPFLQFQNLTNGSFVVSSQTLASPFLTRGAGVGAQECAGMAVAFTWPAPDGDPVKDRPEVTADFRNGDLNGDKVFGILVGSVGGALLVLLGGLAWARDRAPPPPGEEEGTAEALRRALDRMGTQLERTRKHLLFAGILGIFLWYPLLVPWVFRAARAATSDPITPWMLAAGALAFLVVLTLLWAREFVRLDRELAAWRARMGELREREEELLSALDESPGG